MVKLCATIANSPLFQNFIIAVILLAGVLVGIETYPANIDRWGPTLHILNEVVLWIFVAEIVIKMIGLWPRPWHFFKDPWNDFDFIIVAMAFLPGAGAMATVLRLARLLRVLRLLRAIPKLQLLVGALLKSIPSMAYVSILLFLLFYIYACAAVFFWGQNDPIHFADLQISFVSLFRAVTLEDWTDLMYIQMYGCDNYGYDGNEALCTHPSASPVGGAIFFVTFVLFGTMIVLNLFIGVILSGMDEAQAEAREQLEASKPAGGLTMGDELEKLEEQLGDLQKTIARLKRSANRVPASAPAEQGLAAQPAE